MSSFGSAIVKRPYDPPVTTNGLPDSQHYECSDRLRHGREPGIVKIVTTPFHRNLGIHSSSLPSGDFEEQIRRTFRNNAVDRSDPPSRSFFLSYKSSTVRNPIDGSPATTTSTDVDGLRVTSIKSTVRTTRSYVEVGTSMGDTRDVRSFDDLDRVRRNVANNHRLNPTKVIEARRQLDLQRAVSSTEMTINMEKAFAKSKRREKPPSHRPFVSKPAFRGGLRPLDEPHHLPSPKPDCSSPGCDRAAPPPTLSELIGSNILGQAQKNGSPASGSHGSTRRDTSETSRGPQVHNSYALDSLGAALPPELPAGTWNFRPIAASLPYLRPEMKVQNRKKSELDPKPFGGCDMSTRKKVRFARESSGRNLGVDDFSKLEKRSYTERNRAASRASNQNP